ncbi:MAG: bifunctional phosphopantothenoylcysteine decarboxylase/phosphopantothenate--cysteine ligase CoaBC [Limnobacter sp.]|nr:bifunctional phosphopantothenoylcysteine decarboxylase/phosphopantothenate--cysteine ligase CoaBC [Limnobacter sp.]
MNHSSLPLFPSLRGKTVVLGITGGIAAYKAAELVRLLGKQSCTVEVVMTDAACEFIQPLTFQALTGRSVHRSQWQQSGPQRGMPHIDLSRSADCILVAPCSANSLAKYTQGLGQNLLDSLVLARKCPIAIAPAMNVEMWNNPATQRNLQQLKADGFAVFGPANGEQACGEHGEGRMQEPEELVYELARLLAPKPLARQNWLITAGPTYEAIDPVRGLTNRSSGKMGYAMAQAAWLLGAHVHLVTGPTGLATPYGICTYPVQSARNMHHEVFRLLNTLQPQGFAGVAAVADYGIANPSGEKQKKPVPSPKATNSQTGSVAQKTANQSGLQFDLTLNPDILAEVGQWASTHPACTVVGFAAETSQLGQHATEKLARKQADFIVGNLAQHTLGQESTQALVVGKRLAEPIKLPKQSKLHTALQLFALFADHQP